MKLTMEIQGMNAGVSPHSKNPGEEVAYVTVWGHDSNGRYARAKMFDNVALAFGKEVASLLGEGEVLSSKRLVAVFNGEWRAKQFTSNGRQQTERALYAKPDEHSKAFNILDGMALEAARLRNDAIESLKKAEKLRTSGQLALAYEAVAQFVANYAGVPLDLEQFLSDSAAEDAEFGKVSQGAEPEDVAAAHFARTYGSVSEPAKEAEPEVPAQEGTVSDENFQTMDFGEVMGADETNAEISGVVEEDAIVIDTAPMDEADPLDEPTATENKNEEVKSATPTDSPLEEPKQASSAFGTRPSPFGFGARTPGFAPPQGQSAESKPFSTPAAVRQAPQPTARPAPQAEDRPAPQPEAKRFSPMARSGPRF